MKQPIHSQKFLKQRKFLIVLPLLVVPFLIIIFVALGGGKGNEASAQGNNIQGLNLKLPDAHFKKGKDKDKMGLYEEAGRDSLKVREAIKHDPYYLHDSLQENQIEATRHDLQSIFKTSASKCNQHSFSKLKSSLDTNQVTDANEKKVTDKLNQLKAELKKKPDPALTEYTYANTRNSTPDIEKLQRLMASMKQNGQVQGDPELDRINGMLDKVMYIQHPEKLEDSMKTQSLKNKLQTYSVQTIAYDTSDQNGFYGLSEGSDNETSVSNAIRAVIEDNQTLVSGAVVKLRLLQDIYIHGYMIGKDQLVYGIASLSNERLKISITSIRSNDNILPVSLEVYDMDGLSGIYIPGSINRDVSKQSADEAMSSIGLTTLDPSLGAQAASTGIQAAKTLMSKKIKLIRVNLKAGYQVLLKDLNQK